MKNNIRKLLAGGFTDETAVTHRKQLQKLLPPLLKTAALHFDCLKGSAGFPGACECEAACKLAAEIIGKKKPDLLKVARLMECIACFLTDDDEHTNAEIERDRLVRIAITARTPLHESIPSYPGYIADDEEATPDAEATPLGAAAA